MSEYIIIFYDIYKNDSNETEIQFEINSPLNPIQMYFASVVFGFIIIYFYYIYIYRDWLF